MKKILIIDDNPQNLYMLEIMLLSNGYEVEKAANGKEGLTHADHEHPDMIISDILMPVMDGFSLCRAVKTSDTLKNIPFIFYTATYTDPKDEAFALSLGADRFLVKPLEPVEMLKNIHEVFLRKEFGEKVTPGKTIENQEEYYKNYSETLVRKLEDKMVQLERSKNRLSALYQASCDLITIKLSPDLIQSIMHTIVETAGYQHANFFQYDPFSKKLHISKSVGFSQEMDEKIKDQLVFNLGEKRGLVGLVAKTGQPIIIADTSKDPHWMPIDLSIQSALFVPVQYENVLQGVIGLFSREKDAFSIADEQNLSSLANSLAVAIENNRNQEQNKKQLMQLTALHNIDQAISGNIDLPATLNTVLLNVTEQLNVDAADIILFNRFTLSFEFAAGRGFYSRIAEDQEFRKRMIFTEKVILERRLVQIGGVTEKNVKTGEFVSLWEKEGFIAYWGVPLLVRGEVIGVLEVFNRSEMEPDNEWLRYLDTLAGQAAIAIDSADMFDGLQRSNLDLRVAYDATIEGWSRALDLRDNETENHTLRVVETSLELASILGVKNEDLIHIKRGALLHDIGKMGVPDEILHKPGPLTDEEWIIMRKHPQFAYDMLSPIGYLHRALDIPSCHHEKWDGTGYPRQLKGEQIPLAARLFAIVDVWDALRSDRPYRKAWPDGKVMEYLKEESGKHFDPQVVDAFLGLLERKAKQ
ncbi:MAG TPA: HD domain-containing phosphohydrolase [Leptolinea sp.]